MLGIEQPIRVLLGVLVAACLPLAALANEPAGAGAAGSPAPAAAVMQVAKSMPPSETLPDADFHLIEDPVALETLASASGDRKQPQSTKSPAVRPAPDGETTREAALRLILPVLCDFTSECSIQKYFDHDASGTFSDYSCGKLGQNNLTSTAFRLPTLVEMRQRTRVVAAASGVVAGARDGMPDISARDIGVEKLRGLECGNGVIVDHGGGWNTQYCHMMQGSIAVEPGDAVRAGDVLGYIGLSGLTEFPHLGFHVTRDDVPIDPFTGPDGAQSCGDTSGALFDEASLARLPYRPTGLIDAGFANRAVNGRDVQRGAFRIDELTTRTPALVFWIEAFGIAPGDVEEITIFAPDGSVFVEQRDALTSGHLARHLIFVGREARTRLEPGTYRGVYRLFRGEDDERRQILRVEREIEITRPRRAGTVLAQVFSAE